MKNRLRTNVLLPAVLVPALLACLLLSPSDCPAAAKKKSKKGAGAAGPTAVFMFPAGGQRGTTIEATVVGRELEGATAVYVSGSGVTATVIAGEEPGAAAKPKAGPAGKKNKPGAAAPAPAGEGPRPWNDPQKAPHLVRISIVIAPDAELGQRDLRLVTPAGISTRRRFMVDQLREQVAMEPNADKGAALRLESLPAAVNGQLYSGYVGPMGSPDRGYWRFSAQAGQTLVCECQGQVLLPYIEMAVPGWLDACLTLYDADGKRLKYADDFRFKPDPVLFHKVEKNGEYLPLRHRVPQYLHQGVEMMYHIDASGPSSALLILLGILSCCRAATAGETAALSRGGEQTGALELSKHLDKTPALVVVICAGDEGDLTAVAGMVEMTPWTVFCRGAASHGLNQIRNWALEKGLLGSRIHVVEDRGPSLWLAGDMADAVWVASGVNNPPPEQEMLRVLHPGGVCLAAGKILVKPAAGGVDEWCHPYRGPNNNVVSQDCVARLPGELRFQTRPVFAAMPNQTLFAGGRMFFFTGHIAFHEREEPMLNTLTVLNAYNGLRLWSRPLDPNYVVHNLAKLATAKEVVFAEGATLWMLDAATGRQRGKFAVPAEAAAAGDTDWKWIAQDGEILWAALGPPDARVAPHKEKRQMGHWPWDVANAQYKAITEDFGAARRLAAYQYPEMELLWSAGEAEPFDARTLCIEGGRIFVLAPEKYMAARDTATGKELWRKTPETSRELFDAIGKALKRQGWGLGWSTYCCARAGRGVVCIAGPPLKKTICVGLDHGDLLWKADQESPHPFFLDDALYVVPRVGKAFACRKVEPRSGKLLEEFGLKSIGSCTRLTVTPHQFFYRPGGGEGRTVYVDVQTLKLADYEGVVRPGCFDGVVPANGRLYWMPLACDCWQIHGTFSMAPRAALRELETPVETPAWAAPAADTPAAKGDWPLFRADAAGTTTLSAALPKKANELWRRRLPGSELTAPVCAGGRLFLGGSDGMVRAFDAADGKPLWRTSCNAAVLAPPAYWNGRVLVGSCDGFLYCLDATDGRVLGRAELAPERRFVNIMDRLMSAWPLGGGVVLGHNGVVYTAAGSTAADGTVVAALDITTGTTLWRQAYTLDRKEPQLSFGVQGNILLKENTLYINGGAPVGIVALDAATGASPTVASRLDAGMEVFLEPDGKPTSSGPELFCHERASTTIFKRHQNRVYFQTSGRHIALVDGRLFCARDPQALDRIVDLMNKDPKTGGKMRGGTVPRTALHVPVHDSILWAGKTADVCGLAVGVDGLVVLHSGGVEGLSVDGQSLWTVPLPSPPVRWGVALTAKGCAVTLSDGLLLWLGNDSREKPR